MGPRDRLRSACGATGVKHTEWLLANFVKSFGVSKGRRGRCIEEIIEFGKRQHLHRSNLEELVHQFRTASFVGIDPDIALCRLKDGNSTFDIVLG